VAHLLGQLARRSALDPAAVAEPLTAGNGGPYAITAGASEREAGDALRYLTEEHDPVVA
jgi:hypothetical protein